MGSSASNGKPIVSTVLLPLELKMTFGTKERASAILLSSDGVPYDPQRQRAPGCGDGHDGAPNADEGPGHHFIFIHLIEYIFLYFQLFLSIRNYIDDVC